MPECPEAPPSADRGARLQTCWQRLASHEARLWRLVLVLGMGFAVYFSLRTLPQATRRSGDWWTYVQAGQAMRQRQPIYTLERGPLLTFKNAPVVALALAPLSLLPPWLARVLWTLGDIVLLGAVLWLGLQMAFPRGRPARARWLAAGAWLLTSKYIIDQLQSGQTTAWWLFLTVLGFYWTTRGRVLRAGVVIAAAVCLKLVPLCFVPYFLLRRQPWLGLGACTGTIAILLVVPALWVGWEANAALLRQWPRHMQETDIPAQVTRVQNQSAYAQLGRFFMPSSPVSVGTLSPATVWQLWLGLSCLVAAGLYGWMWRTRRRGEPCWLVHLGALLVFMTLFNPLAWRNNFTALLIPHLLVLAALARWPKGAWALIGLLALEVALGAIPHARSDMPFPDVPQALGARFFGTLLLFPAMAMAGRVLLASAESRPTAHRGH